MKYDQNRALQLLRIGTGISGAHFREGQEEAIKAIVSSQRRVLVVQKTGWGKSFVYFIAAKLLRESGAGATLLISPLLALMRNQQAAAERMELVATTYTSDNKDKWTFVQAQIQRKEIDVLLIHPKKLTNEDFLSQVLSYFLPQVAFLVIDEAHCISDWGHDFVPEYRLIERIARTLPPNHRLLATTATANNRVIEDLKNILGPELSISRGDLCRPSLALQTIRLTSQAERLAWLADLVPTLPGTGIIYALTIRDAVQIADWLGSRGINVVAYTSKSEDLRPELEQALLENRVKALVATIALGMGYDKPDLVFVIHYQMPGSVIAYYQQVGRAGRALKAAYGVLLCGKEDAQISNYFIDSAFPTEEEVRMVLTELEHHPGGLSVPALESIVNLSYGRINKTLHLLSLEAPPPVVKQGSAWQLTAAKLGPGFWVRTRRLTAKRRAELRQMQEYVILETGHMEFLIRALDGDPPSSFTPPLPPLRLDPDPRLIGEATAYLRRSDIPLPPRLKWPAAMTNLSLKGPIESRLRAQEGRALGMWRDAGWGQLVYEGKYRQGRFDDDLVTACLTLLKRWHPEPSPLWVTCIPSLRHPDLVPDFTRRLAQALGLRFQGVLEKIEARPEQKTMSNSAQQIRNLYGSLAVHQPLPPGPVLLVDDMVDSRWTFTYAAWLLRLHGSGPVWPLALAMTGHDQ